ncbi:MAG: PAS domain S-box protein [Gammaproteobacteria bacterium]
MIGLILTFLLYRSYTKHLEKDFLIAIELQTAALSTELSRLKNIAAQVTSRTRVREELEKYNEGRIDLESLSAFSGPMLTDAMRLTPDIVGIGRLDAEGNFLFQAGAPIPVELWPDDYLSESIRLGLPQEMNGRQILTVSAPIINRSGKKVGIDLVAFDCRELQSIMQGFFRRFNVGGGISVAAMAPNGARLFFSLGDVDGHELTRLISKNVRPSSSESAKYLEPTYEIRDSYFLARRLIGDSGWTFLFSNTVHDFFTPARLQAAYSGISLVMLALIGCGLTLRFIQPLSGGISVENETLRRLLKERDKLLGMVQTSESRLEQAQKVAQIGSWELDHVEHNLWWSDEVYRIFEVERHILPSYELYIKRVHPEDRDAVEQAHADSVANRTPYEITYRLQCEDGRRKYVNERGQPFYDETGEALCTIGTAQDITERLLQERERDRLHAILDALVDGSTDAIFVKDRESRYLLVNQAISDLFGKDKTEIIGADDFDLFPDDMAARFRSDDIRVMAEGLTETYEEPVIAAGQTLQFLTTKGPLIIDGKIIGIFGIARDINERKKAERALRESEKRFRAIFENTLDGILVADADDKRFLDGNATICRMLGYDREEISQLSVNDIHPKQYLPFVIEQFERQRKQEIMIAEDIPVQRRDGSVFYADISAAPFDLEGRTYLVGLFRDITQRKLTEKALRENESLYRELVNNMSDGVAIYDAADGGKDFIFKDYNHAGEHITGISREKLIGRSVKEIFPGIEEYGLFDVFRRVWRSEKPEHHPLNCYRDERLSLWLENYVFKLPGGEIVTIFKDVTERKQAVEELNRAATEWTQAMDGFDDAIYLIDMESRLLRANRAFYRLIDSDEAHCRGRPVSELVHLHNGASNSCPVCEAQEKHRECVITLEPDHPSNFSENPLEITIKMVRSNSGDASGMLVSIRDLSHSRRIEERLRLAAGVFENTLEGVIITDAKGDIIEINPAFTEILGYTREEVIGRTPRLWKSGRHEDDFYADMWRSLLKTGQWRGEIWNRHKNGSVLPEWLTVSRLQDDSGRLTHYVGVYSDISHLKNSQAQLDHLAHHDALTDLPNRNLLNERLEQAIRHAERHGYLLAVIFADLDRFKHINDSLGHPAGDRLLREVAAHLLKFLRQEDTVARIGGDEFVLLLEDIDKPENAAVTAEKLLAAFAQPFKLDGHNIRISVSFGISIYPHDGKDSATLLRNADAAMYHAKRKGRNAYEFYTEDLTHHAYEKVMLENYLIDALEKNQLHLHYQPQVDLRTGSIVGVEALVRWPHPDLGEIAPARFIPLAEECGLIYPLGQWVLETACRQGIRWLNRNIEFGRIAVNISGAQIQQGRLAKDVGKILEESRFPASKLELEVTESFVMSQAESAIVQLKALRRLGTSLAIDDFGTGYSSLSYLKKMPFQKIKIDQSFILDIPGNANDMAIADSIIAISKSLGLAVIAEGVETEEQERFLINAGCQEAQGFYYSRPLAPEALERLLLKKKS